MSKIDMLFTCALFCVLAIFIHGQTIGVEKKLETLEEKLEQVIVQKTEQKKPKKSIQFFSKQYVREICNISDDELAEIFREVGHYSRGRVLLAIAIAESHLQNKKHSQTAWGLMGVNPQIWADELVRLQIIQAPEDLLTVKGSFKAGNYIFTKYLQKANNNFHKALEYYVNGPYTKKKTNYPNKVRKYLCQLIVEETNATINHN